MCFKNGQEKTDPEINELKSKLVEVAFEQKSWGKRMPIAWVPLELQMSELRLHKMNIISKEELITLNQRNEDSFGQKHSAVMNDLKIFTSDCGCTIMK
jgi:hypothetical protein